MRLRKGSGPSRLFPERLEVDQLGLGLADDALHRARRQPLLVVAQLGGDHLDQASRVAVVVDREARAEAQPVGVGPQDPQAGRVERGDPHLVGRRPDELDHPGPHLVGRLVGEGDGQDPPGRRVPGRHQVRDAPGQHARLPEPAPAMISKGPPRCSTAARWGRVRSSTRAAGRPDERARRSRRAPAPAGFVDRDSASSARTSSSAAAAAAAAAPTPSSEVSKSWPLPAEAEEERPLTPTQWSRAASTSRRAPPGSRPPPR